MNKSLFVIVSFVLLIFSASSYSSKEVDAKVGCIAPDFALANEDSSVSLRDMKGKYVLLSFWNSADADSRMNNIKYSSTAKNFDSELALVSVNYDRCEEVYHEIVKRDKLQTGSQFYDQDGKMSRIYSDYRLDQGYKSYLINPAGKIIAENPDAYQLANIIRQ